MSAEYVLARNSHDQAGPLTVQLAIHANMSPADSFRAGRRDITLPAGTDELVVRTDLIDGSSLPLTFTVAIPEQSAGLVRAGLARELQLADTVDRDVLPPMLQSKVRATDGGFGGIGQECAAALLPAVMPPTYASAGRAGGGRRRDAAGGRRSVGEARRPVYRHQGSGKAARAPSWRQARRSFGLLQRRDASSGSLPSLESAEGTARFPTPGRPSTVAGSGSSPTPEAGTPPIMVKIEAAVRH